MALVHGVPLWWVDDLVNPLHTSAPWKGLPGAGRDIVDLHRGSGCDWAENGSVVERYSVRLDWMGSTKSLLETIVSNELVDPNRFTRARWVH